jgi:hypothetical protein
MWVLFKNGVRNICASAPIEKPPLARARLRKVAFFITFGEPQAHEHLRK